MRSYFIPATILLFAFSYVQAQSGALPVNPDPNPHPAQIASLNGSVVNPIHDSDSSNASGTASSVANSTSSNGEVICGITHLGRCIQDLGEDEKGIFTSPLRVQAKDAYWLAPLGAATGLAFAYDADAAQAAGVDPDRTRIANRFANFGSFLATGAEGAGIYFIGVTRKNPKLAETGRLGAEAVIDSGTVTLVTKLVTNRQRPRQGNGQGDFWPFGTDHWEWDSSFPSDHATASMALARVVSGEYPHWYVVVPAYGFAESLSITRILANQHFPSDIVVGQAIGFLTGSYLLNHRALYRPGAKRTLAARLIGSVDPIVNAQTRALGATVQIPFGR